MTTWKNIETFIKSEETKQTLTRAALSMMNHSDKIDFDALQYTTEQLLALLKNREPGLMTWNEMLVQKLCQLHKYTSAVQDHRNTDGPKDPVFLTVPFSSSHLSTCEREPRDEEWICDELCPIRLRRSR